LLDIGTIIHDSSSVDGGWRTAIQEHAYALRGMETGALADAVFAVRDWY